MDTQTDTRKCRTVHHTGTEGIRRKDTRCAREDTGHRKPHIQRPRRRTDTIHPGNAARFHVDRTARLPVGIHTRSNRKPLQPPGDR